MRLTVLEHQHLFAPGRAFGQCHASTLTRLPDGSLFCAWFGGSQEGASDVCIYGALQSGERWSAPFLLASGDGEPCWNPVLYTRPDGRTLLYFKRGAPIARWRSYVQESQGCLAWSDARELCPGDEGGVGPVKNKPLPLPDGTLLGPASTEGADGWRCFADLSQDGGLHFSRGAEIPMDRRSLSFLGVIQPSFWLDAQGVVHALMRSGEGFLYASHSLDMGRSWSLAEKASVPNNNCGIDLCRLDNGLLVLCHNPVSGNWGPRSPLILSVSQDEGRTFTPLYWLDHVPCEKNETGAEFSYPAILSHGNEMDLSYTWKRQTIVHWRLRLEL